MLATVFVFAATIAAPTDLAQAEVPALIARLKASYGPDSWSAVDRLTSIGSRALPALVGVLNDRSLGPIDGVAQPARSQAARALGNMGATAAPAVSVLLVLLGDRHEDDGVRSAAAAALGSIGERPQEIVPALISVIDELGTGSGVSFSAVLALAKLSDAPSAQPALTQAQPRLRLVRKRYESMTTACLSLQKVFLVFEPATEQRLWEEDDIRVAVLQHRLGPETSTWCLDESVSDAVFDRLGPVAATRDERLCQASEGRRGEGQFVMPRYRRLSLGQVCWISADKAQVSINERTNSPFSRGATYLLERRGNAWAVASGIEDLPGL